MKMLGSFFVIVGLLCFSTSAFGELSVEDLEKIREIVNEGEVRLGKHIDGVEVRLGKRIDEGDVRLGKRIDEGDVRLGERISTEIQALGKRIDYQGQLIIALIVAILAFVAVPMGLLFINTTVTAINKKQKVGRSAINKKKSKLRLNRMNELLLVGWNLFRR